ARAGGRAPTSPDRMPSQWIQGQLPLTRAGAGGRDGRASLSPHARAAGPGPPARSGARRRRAYGASLHACAGGVRAPARAGHLGGRRAPPDGIASDEMSAQVIDGKAVAARVRERVAAEVAELREA